ncbi:aminotransferase class I/II-fold pyridoxal phosphate-dependent enzyme [Saccharopolyspora hattusasensis]|uniref:aminotransferase class I/II-fold pyridoxal phosphate-dependent enzyme n=1 Tax=Saccharopolyspora hattusasensis TaxID=1128679 RepID=UPI003D9866FA
MVVNTLGSRAIRLDRNECPGPLPGVADVLRSDADGWHRYPSDSSVLAGMLAAETHGNPDSVVLGAGSMELLARLLQIACGGIGGEVIFAAPSPAAYSALARQAGATSVRVPTTSDGVTDVEAMAEAAGPATRVMIVCNPHNPTGSVLRRPQLHGLLDQVDPSVLVVIDEAYREFVYDPDVPDGAALARSRPNVITLRTFSTAYGLAGLRVGYAIAQPPVATVLRHAGLAHQISAPAQIAAMASLPRKAELAARTAFTAGERERIRSALRDNGLDTPPSHGNFTWIPLRYSGEQFRQLCAEHGIIIAAYPGAGVRISVSSPAENIEFIELAAQARRVTRPDRRALRQDTVLT